MVWLAIHEHRKPNSSTRGARPKLATLLQCATCVAQGLAYLIQVEPKQDTIRYVLEISLRCPTGRWLRAKPTSIMCIRMLWVCKVCNPIQHANTQSTTTNIHCSGVDWSPTWKAVHHDRAKKQYRLQMEVSEPDTKSYARHRRRLGVMMATMMTNVLYFATKDNSFKNG